MPSVGFCKKNNGKTIARALGFRDHEIKGGPHFFSGFFFFLHIIVAISLNKNFSKFYDKFMHTF